MSYESVDVSQQDAAPVLLYQFNRGLTTWRYAALQNAFTALGYSWAPEVISCSDIASTGEIPKDQVSIAVPSNNAMAAPFLAYAPDLVTTVTIFRTFYDNPTLSRAEWKGRVLSAACMDEATLSLTCEPVFTSLHRMGLRQTYQRTCRHMLFGPGCNVNRALFAATVTVVAVSGVTVTLSAAPAIDYKGGTIKASDDSLRMIVGQAGAVLTLMRPVQQLLQDMAVNPSGFSATLYRGCDKSTRTCHSIFNNLGNFGGFPGITGINPMNGTSNVF